MSVQKAGWVVDCEYQDQIEVEDRTADECAVVLRQSGDEIWIPKEDLFALTDQMRED